MIKTQIMKAGGKVRYYGQLADELDACFTAVQSAMDEVDILITTGGVSVGDYDYQLFMKDYRQMYSLIR